MVSAPSAGADSAPQAIGVDLGGTNMRVCVLGPDRAIVYRSDRVSLGLTTEELLAALEAELLAAQRAQPGVVAAGLGIPCTIDRERGVAINAVNLPLSDVPIRDRMAERLGIPVAIDNDGNVAAFAEYLWGAARGARNAVVLTIGTGVGGGLILDGKPYRGSTGAGAEIGHMVVDLNGPRCQGTCSNYGCIESVASGTALGAEGRAAAERHPGSELGRRLTAGDAVDGRAVTEAAQAGDEVARETLATIGRRLGAAFSSLANVFEPDVIVVGGGAIAAGELLLEPAREELRRRALPPMNATRVVPAELGPDAGVLGAAGMALAELGTVV